MLEMLARSGMNTALRLGILLTVAGIGVAQVANEVSFRPPVDISGGTVRGVSCMDAADITGNGRKDIVVIEGGKHAGGRSTFAWFEATGDAANQWRRHEFGSSFPLKSFLGAARLADIDGDGDPDLVVSADNHSNAARDADVLVFLNPRPDGDVRAAWPVTVVAKGLPVHHINDMEIADLDGDGRLDVIVRSLEPNQIHLFFQSGNGWGEHRTIDTNLAQSEGLAVGDLNRDGRPEITFTGYVLIAPVKPRTEEYLRIPVDADYHTVNQNTKEALGDLDGDGWPDLVLAPAEQYRNGKPHLLAWYRNPGGRLREAWQRHEITTQINNLHTVKLGDINGDGSLDVVTGQPWGALEVRIYFNDGKGRFPRSQRVAEGKGLYSGVVVDLDGDGDMDLIGQDTYARESRPYVFESLRIP
jgi:hypothetical protein